MGKLTIKKKYGITPNNLLNDPKISFKAKGLFAFIQSKDDDWDFSAERISNQTLDGLDSVKSALKELEINGYLIRKKYKLDNGYFDIEYILFEKPWDELPTAENPPSDSPSTENGTNNSKKDNSKNTNSKKEIRYNALNVDLPFSSDEFKEAWKDWVEYRNQSNSKLTEGGVKRQLKLLLSQGELFATKMLDKAIMNSWTGLFELTENEKSAILGIKKTSGYINPNSYEKDKMVY